MNKKIIWLVFAIVVIISAALFFSSMKSSGLLWSISNGGKFIMPLIVTAALVDSINPCAISILLLTIAFLFSIGKLRSRILQIGFFYITGIFLVYVGIGLGILKVLHLFNTPHFMAKVGALLLIGWGLLELVNEFFPSFPIKLKIPNFTHQSMGELMEKGSLPTAFALGALVGICEFPCTGGPYLLALGLLHDSATYWTGFGYLVFYNIIFVAPLVVILMIASDHSLFEKVQAWKKSETGNMRFWSGVAMIVLGVIMFML